MEQLWWTWSGSTLVAVSYTHLDVYKRQTQVIAYTIANLMENGVVKRTQDERFYFDEQNWNQLKKKVNVGYLVLIGLPLILFLIFLFVKYVL